MPSPQKLNKSKKKLRVSCGTVSCSGGSTFTEEKNQSLQVQESVSCLRICSELVKGSRSRDCIGCRYFIDINKLDLPFQSSHQVFVSSFPYDHEPTQLE